MNTKFFGVIAALCLAITTTAYAAPLKLTPANPQPSGLKPGLSVKYAWGGPPLARIDSLEQAGALLAGAKRGKPLRGLDYRETNVGDPVLTYHEHFNVAADIRGYIRFDAPGIYVMEIWSNDGAWAWISGQTVGYNSDRTPCDPGQQVTVEVPQAGWYDLKVRYFQKYKSSCLMMKWGKQGSKLKWVPNNVFGYR